MTHEQDSPLAEDVHISCRCPIVLCVLAHREAERLADHVVEGHGEEVSAQEEQA